MDMQLLLDPVIALWCIYMLVSIVFMIVCVYHTVVEIKHHLSEIRWRNHRQAMELIDKQIECEKVTRTGAVITSPPQVIRVITAAPVLHSQPESETTPLIHPPDRWPDERSLPLPPVAVSVAETKEPSPCVTA